MNLLTDFCFLDSVSLLSRGWIVPVGGSTPDRLKVAPDRLSGDRRQMKEKLKFGHPADNVA